MEIVIGNRSRDSSKAARYFKRALKLIRKNDVGAEAPHLVINMKMLR
jgi:hypothetical protein